MIRLQNLVAIRQQDKQNLSALEKKLQEERKAKGNLEQQLANEKKAKKEEASKASVKYVPFSEAVENLIEANSLLKSESLTYE